MSRSLHKTSKSIRHLDQHSARYAERDGYVFRDESCRVILEDPDCRYGRSTIPVDRSAFALRLEILDLSTRSCCA